MAMYGIGQPNPCTTTHRLRLSEYKHEFEVQGLAAISRKGLWAVNAKREERAAKAEEKKGNSVTRRAMLGLVAVVSPALLASGAGSANVEPPMNEPLQTIESRIDSSSLHATEARIQSPANTSAPSLKDNLNFRLADVQPIATTLTQDAGSVPKVEEQEASRSDSGGFWNGIGVVSSGVLGALYWLEGRAKATSKSALEEANKKLEKAEASMISLKKSLEDRLVEQKTQSQQELRDSEENRSALASELASTKSAGKELQLQFESQKNVSQNLDKKVKAFQVSIKESEENRKSLEDKLLVEQKNRHKLENELNSVKDEIKEKDESIDGLNSNLKEEENIATELRMELCATKESLNESESKFQDLAKKFIVAGSILEERGAAMEDLQKELAAAVDKANDSEQNLVTVRQELNDLKQSTSKKIETTNDALASKQEEVKQMISKLEVADVEAKHTAKTITSLRKDIHKLENLLCHEQATAKKLSDELKSAMQKFQDKSKEATSLSSELKGVTQEMDEIKKQKYEIEIAAAAKNHTLAESLKSEQILTSKVKHQLDDTTAALNASSLEVKSLSEKLKANNSLNNRLKGEIEDMKKSAEKTSVTLSEEKKKIVAAEKQFMETQKALAREEMLVQSLRSEFSKAMDAMNDLRKHLDSLSKDLQDANVKIASLESDKCCLQEIVAKEKKVTKKMKEKTALAESTLAKLVDEKEGSLSKARRLEDELSCAEGEMMKLKDQITVMGSAIDNAESRMGSIAQVSNEINSLVKKFEELSTKIEQKGKIKSQLDRLKEQSKAATEISKELRNMKKLLSHFHQNLEDAEVVRVDAQASLQAAVVKRKPNEEQLQTTTTTAAAAGKVED